MRFTLICDGVAWQGWQQFSVRQNLENVAHSFTISTNDREQEGLERWNVRGGSLIEFYIDDDLIVSGFVRRYSPSITADSHSITVEGESAAIDLVDCSHLGPYFWPAGPAETVIEDVLGPFGLKLRLDKRLKSIPKEGFRVGVNESPFEIIRKLLERDQLLFYTDRENNLVASDGRNTLDGGSIGRGDYVSISAEHDLSNSYSEIIVRAQRNDFGEDTPESHESNQRIERRVRNTAETRYRPIVFMNSGEDEAQKELAEDIRRRFSGDVITAQVQVKSHKNKKGEIWAVNQRVFLTEPLIDVKQSLVTSEVEFSLDETSGFSVNLSLKLPVAFDNAPPSARAVRLADDGPFQALLKSFADSGEG